MGDKRTSGATASQSLSVGLERLRQRVKSYEGSEYAQVTTLGYLGIPLAEVKALLAVVDAAQEADTVYELVRKGIASEDDLLSFLYTVRLKLAALDTATAQAVAPKDSDEPAPATEKDGAGEQ